MHGRGALVFFPCGAGDVAADDSFNGEDLELSNLHGAVLEQGHLGGWYRGRQREGEEVGFQVGDLGREDGEPVGGEEGQEDALGGNTLWQVR